MTVKKLIEQLNKYPDNMEVFVAERKTEFTYGLVNSVRCDEIYFYEDVFESPLAKDRVVIIDEE